MSADARNNPKKRVLLVYYSFTGFTQKVVDVMADTLATGGVEVTKAAIEFTDHHYGDRFSTHPMHLPILKIGGMLPAQLRKRTAAIGIPSEAQTGDYDLVIFGSPTWWLTTNMPVRSYLHDPAAKSVLDGRPFAAFSVSRRYWKGNVGTIKELGEGNGGRWQGETHFTAEGNQVMSMWSWLAYMRQEKPRERSFGVKMPRPNLKLGFEQQAKQFVDDLAGRVLAQPAGGA